MGLRGWKERVNVGDEKLSSWLREYDIDKDV